MNTWQKWLLTFFIIIIGWTSYYDISHGTLPLITNPTTASAKTPISEPSKPPVVSTKQITVQSGDTVLSIEERLNGKTPPSIAQMITDFKALNPSVDPNKIEIGRTYTFKIYAAK